MELNPFELEESLTLKPEEPRNSRYYKTEYNYKQIVDSITNRVDWLIEAGYTERQGDLYYFGVDKVDDTSVYFLDTGYGTCTACDTLLRCDSFQEVLDLRDSLKRRVRKFSNIVEFVKWYIDIFELEYRSKDDLIHFIHKFKETYDVDLPIKEVR